MSKIVKPKDVGHFLVQNLKIQNLVQNLKILIFAHARDKTSHIAMLVARKPSCCDVRAFLTGLKVIWPRLSLESTKMSKKLLSGKKLWGSMG